MANTLETRPVRFTKMVPSPKQIVEYLDERVIGQADAKRQLAVAVYNHYKRVALDQTCTSLLGDLADVEIEKSNIIMLGGTGTGKTFLVQNIAKMLNVPCYIQDCTKLTESGYVGDDVENCLAGLLRACNYNVEKAEMGIVCLDEVDKLTYKGYNASLTRDVGGEGVQQGLLKIVESNKVGVMPQGGRKHPEQPLTYIDTTNILFIAMGAFPGLEKSMGMGKQSIGFAHNTESLPEEGNAEVLDRVTANDLIRFGLIPEFVGRFPVILHTNPLKEDDLVRIISEPKNSILKQYQKLFKMDNKDLFIEPAAMRQIAHAAIVSGTGARGLRAMMEKVLGNLMFDCANNKKQKVMIKKEYVDSILDRVLEKADMNRLRS